MRVLGIVAGIGMTAMDEARIAGQDVMALLKKISL